MSTSRKCPAFLVEYGCRALSEQPEPGQLKRIAAIWSGCSVPSEQALLADIRVFDQGNFETLEPYGRLRGRWAVRPGYEIEVPEPDISTIDPAKITGVPFWTVVLNTASVIRSDLWVLEVIHIDGTFRRAAVAFNQERSTPSNWTVHRVIQGRVRRQRKDLFMPRGWIPTPLSQ
jgi:hypothetical protein